MIEQNFSKPIDGLRSKKWLWAGLIITALNPIFSGVILGALYTTEPGLKKYGRIILPLAAIWGAIAFWLTSKYLPVSTI
ncbi:MAG: hypothetical protein Q8Q95_02505 [bacterium]|nr:hypothetical protein [bacterium]